MEIVETLDEFLTEIQIRNYSKRTVRSYRDRLRMFARWCESEGIEDADDIKLSTVKKYAKHMLDKGNKGSTVNGNLKVLRSYLNFCWEERFGAFDVAAVKRFPWVKAQKPHIVAFTDRQVKQMLAACDSSFLGQRDKCLLTIAFSVGARCAEMYNIKDSDIHLDAGYMVLHGKGGRDRVANISPILRREITRYLRIRESYFDGGFTEDWFLLSRNGRQLTNSAVEKIFLKRGELIENRDSIRVSPHTARHYFSQSMLKQGVDVYTLQRLLGHSSISVTEAYLSGLSDKAVLKKARENDVLMNLK